MLREVFQHPEGRQGIEQERYLTLTVERKNFEEAKAQFATLEAVLHKIKQALVVFPHVIHDFLNVFFLHALCIGNFRGKVIVFVPYSRQVETMRTMLTQSLAALLPFNVQELNDAGGNYYGINQISKNINVGNRKT